MLPVHSTLVRNLHPCLSSCVMLAAIIASTGCGEDATASNYHPGLGDSGLDGASDGSPVDTSADTPAPKDGTTPSDALQEPTSDSPVEAASDADAQPPVHDLLQVDNTTGWQIYSGGGYRYGPSIILHGDGTIDLWSCSPGENGAWDFIRHRSSNDGGHSWTSDDVALAPTPGSKDAFSTCDPGAIKIGAWYYVGYTSTENAAGTANELYVARANAAAGPYAKWDGSGWGGSPVPIVHYTAASDKYGIGEPSLVVQGGKLFVYYTNNDETGNFTDLAIAPDANDEAWPSKLAAQGHVVTHGTGQDSIDVKYVDAHGRFLAIGSYDRFGPNATVRAYQSTDGIHFEPAPFKGSIVQDGAHNLGISGTEEGHLDLVAANFIAYAYAPAGSSWGNWPTHLDPITLSLAPVGTSIGGAVSSIVDWNWSGPRAWDGNPGTVFSSTSHGGTADANEWVVVDLGSSLPVKGVSIVPRASALGFPVDFAIQSSEDASSWVDIAGQVFSSFPAPTGASVDLPFPAPVTARFLRLNATRLGVDDNGNHYLQIAEMTATF